MMKEVQNAVYSLVSTRGKGCYVILCHAVDIALAYQPDMPQMRTIYQEICLRTKKHTPSAVAKALDRAAKDIWLHGKREALHEYWIEEAATAKELVCLISTKLWIEKQ